MANLEGQRIALAEGRQQDELAEMVSKEGAEVLRYPLISIIDTPDQAPVETWIKDLISGRFDFLILMTGEGIRRLAEFANRMGLRTEFLAGLQKTSCLSRGPKPNQVLKEFGLAPVPVSESPTSAGIVASLKKMDLAGKCLALTRHGKPSPEIEDYLTSSAIEFHPVQPYLYIPDSDDGKVEDLVFRMGRGEIDVLILTSSPQVDRMFEVVDQRGLQEKLADGLSRTRLAAVGPLVAENLRRRGASAAITPEKGFVMKNLVQLIKKNPRQEPSP